MFGLKNPSQLLAQGLSIFNDPSVGGADLCTDSVPQYYGGVQWSPCSHTEVPRGVRTTRSRFNCDLYKVLIVSGHKNLVTRE